jgi:integrase
MQNVSGHRPTNRARRSALPRWSWSTVLARCQSRTQSAIEPSDRVNTRNRKLKEKRKLPVYLESAEQIAAMIDAATELDAKPQARTAGRRVLIATLVYAGLRIGEATALTWQDIDLANGRISVGDSKTEAGIRLVDILPALRDELTSHRHAAATARPDELVSPTSSGSRRDKDNARERVICPVVAHADTLLARRGHRPMPEGVTAHSSATPSRRSSSSAARTRPL